MHIRTVGIIAFAAALAGHASAQPADGLPKLDVPPPINPSATPAGQPLCSPERLTRMVVRNISPGLAAGSPVAQPRTLYRHGPMRMRTEESPDPARGQPVMVVSEPDIWMFNSANRKGQHQVDPGPDFFVHAPILPIAPDLPPQLLSLEYGCEVDFLRRMGAEKPRQAIPWGNGQATIHQVQVGEHIVSILLSQGRGWPLLIAYAKAGKGVFMTRYDEFRNDLPDRPDLFGKPDLVEFVEAPPGGPPPAGTPQPTPGQPPTSAPQPAARF